MDNLIQIKIDDEQLENIRLQLHGVAVSEIERVKNDVKDPSPFVKKNETCKYLHISNNTLDKMIILGFPKITVGGVTRFDKREIDKWLYQHNE
ncbi:helix-turn-helix domain-containing protein [Enterococcus sp. DIV0660C]|uniref:helix-turn-helix transcriptional regulator n=1 Tax=Enterococcus sp. DIV0660C TaxID=2230880 RepID=UPI001A8DDA23|nr:helix-turn-helix domain-containing protein [Enterococcus sp. DIV0660C]MBO0431338.1 helix-turn-helix domain-containing protein [Enterococcus sp. DIV0660C]